MLIFSSGFSLCSIGELCYFYINNNFYSPFLYNYVLGSFNVNSFSDDVGIDGDDPSHIKWIYQKSIARADDYSIPGVTYRLTQGQATQSLERNVNSRFVLGVIKRIIPAVASTNAIIAAACATEVLKIASRSLKLLRIFPIKNSNTEI